MREDQAIELEGELPPPPQFNFRVFFPDLRADARERGRHQGAGEGAGDLRPRSVHAWAISAQRGCARGVWAAPAALPYRPPQLISGLVAN